MKANASMKAIIKWLGIAVGCLVLWVVVNDIQLPITGQCLYGTYQSYGRVLELNPDGTYRFVARFPGGPCISCQGRWKLLPDGYGVEPLDDPLLVLEDFADQPGAAPESRNKWLVRPLGWLGEVFIMEDPEVYAEKVPPEAFVPCGQGPGEEDTNTGGVKGQCSH